MVEDETEMLRATATALTDATGCKVKQAATSADALRMLDSDRGIDLVFADCHLPDMDGMSLAKAIRARRPDIPIVIGTGFYAMLDTIEHAGFVAVLKPYTVERLNAVFTEKLRPAD